MQDTNESAFIVLFSLLSSKINKRIDGNLSVHGISFTEYLIIHHLQQAPDKTMRRVDLADRIGISPSGVTRLLSPMEKNKITEKEINPRDARMSLVKLTATGERLYQEASVTFQHCAQSITEKISTKQLENLLRSIHQLL